MTVPLRADELVMPLLLVKAVLAILAVVLFLYYRHYWNRAKHHLAVHFFFAKWRAVRHAFILGFAAVGFAIGFTLELFGQQLGLGATAARFVSSIFEVGSLFCMLYVFFTLALEDVPHFQHISEAARHHKRLQEQEVKNMHSGIGKREAAESRPAKAKKAARKRKGKKRRR
jgi:hypothetical protein